MYQINSLIYKKPYIQLFKMESTSSWIQVNIFDKICEWLWKIFNSFQTKLFMCIKGKKIKKRFKVSFNMACFLFVGLWSFLTLECNIRSQNLKFDIWLFCFKPFHSSMFHREKKNLYSFCLPETFL